MSWKKLMQVKKDAWVWDLTKKSNEMSILCFIQPHMAKSKNKICLNFKRRMKRKKGLVTFKLLSKLLVSSLHARPLTSWFSNKSFSLSFHPKKKEVRFVEKKKKYYQHTCNPLNMNGHLFSVANTSLNEFTRIVKAWSHLKRMPTKKLHPK